MQRVLGLLLLWPLVADSKAFPARSSATHSGTFIWRRRSTKSPFVCHPHPPLDTVSPQHVDFLALPDCDVREPSAHMPTGLLREARGQEARSTCMCMSDKMHRGP